MGRAGSLQHNFERYSQSDEPSPATTLRLIQVGKGSVPGGTPGPSADTSEFRVPSSTSSFALHLY
eukprot:57899-Hanusia_phi.AAC.1